MIKLNIKELDLNYIHKYPTKDELEEFNNKLQNYLEKLKKVEKQTYERNTAGKLGDFFKNLKFEAEIEEGKANSNIDLVLKNNEKTQVIIEAKIPGSKEFITPEKPNVKALWECVLYFMRLEVNEKIFIKHLIITDFYKFYIFTKKEIEKIANIKEVKEIHKNKQNNDEFYKALSVVLNEQDLELNPYFIDLKEENDKTLLFKIFTKEFLFDDYNINDSNVLNKKFYDELLYILGLQEKDEKIVKSTSKDSTLYNLIEKELISKDRPSDFDSVIRYIIIWLNRILFLKLIETNLKNFNKNDEKAKFLSFEKVKDFQNLNYLFFEIFAKNFENRDKNSEFYFLPYLNSSLFTKKEDLESHLQIKELNNHGELEYYKNTILKDSKTEKTLNGKTNWLKYFLDFLDAFDFGTTNENETKINKELINSSVLGLVFEKLNGYKEGSYYTPNFITSYMCEKGITQAILDKYSTKYDIKFQSIEKLREYIDRNFDKLDEFKQLFFTLRICDPAVGSAHFLVSALCELMKIAYKLGFINSLLRGAKFQIINDEIIITKIDGEIFKYTRPKNLEDSDHEIQKELFNLKKSIIENNLFGVDINPNSVEIARLRLWIELLKNSYYLDENKEIHNLATLPNIDINIKCGNSLISRFSLDDKIEQDKKELKKEIEQYKENILKYKNTNDKEIKANLEKLIQNSKDTLKEGICAQKEKKSYEKLLGEYMVL